MTYTNQSREKIVLQLLTINPDVMVPYDMIVQEFWGSVENSRPSPKYIYKIISGVRNMIPYGKVEHIHGQGYVFRPIFYKRPMEVRRANQRSEHAVP